ncbi:MAG: hypothetical protein QM648_11550 [Solirubrobacterales bacterium]
MARTTVDVDEQALEAAKLALGTTKISETVNAALRGAARRHALKDFSVLRDVPIESTAAEIKAGRTREFGSDEV